jgi:glycosyltransferase involved in cell wall biosynthesis
MNCKVVKLIYQSYLPYQGRYPRVSGQAKILQQHGFDVVVLACDREGNHPVREALEGIPVRRIAARTGEMRGPFRQFTPLLLFWIKSLKWLLKNHFDILHFHNIDVLPVGYLVKLLKRCPVVYESHEPNYYAFWPKKLKPILKLFGIIEKTMATKVDLISVTNDYQINKYKQLGARQVELVGNYPLPYLRVDKFPVEKFNGGPITFGRLGTIYADTGFEASVEAFSRILTLYPETRWLIAGRIVDTYQDQFYDLLKPIRQQVQLVEAYPAREMVRLYKQIDVSLLVYPRSDFFRFITPRKFYDSLANCVPVIMTDIGGLGNVIRRRKCGIVVDDQNIDTIVEAMRLAIENTSLRKNMAINAHNLAETEFNWQAMATRYARLQENLLISQPV